MSWDREKERRAGKAYHVGSSLFGVIFAVAWCIIAASMGAWPMLLFGIPFAGLMVFHMVMGIRHMQAEEKKSPPPAADPWDSAPEPRQETGTAQGGFCPYCGGSVDDSFSYCPKCGRRLK